MTRTLRTPVVCQNQEALPDRSSFCGMFSVNNALQKRDFLTRIAMKQIRKQLKVERPKEDHGSEWDGAYTAHAIHQALQKHGKRLVFMNKRFKCKSDKLVKKVMWCKKPALLIMGRRPGQQEGSWHCIARTTVSKKNLFIEFDSYMYFPNTVEKLSSYFEHVDGVYAIEDIEQ